VYAALYFILTIIASAGLYLIMSAEFMAFALIIVYAGAILITYLFVIMLASQGATEGDDGGEAEFDVVAREPIGAAVVGFVMLAALSSLAFKGAAEVPKTAGDVMGMRFHALATPSSEREMSVLKDMPRRLTQELRAAGVLKGKDEVMVSQDGVPRVDVGARTVRVRREGGTEEAAGIPASVMPLNVESVGFSLLADHPGSIEIAGVILLMAMLGAVVLSRKQVELEEDAKRVQARRLAGVDGGAA
jgi:NADH-quinone oxidoreductase subunit J